MTPVETNSSRRLHENLLQLIYREYPPAGVSRPNLGPEYHLLCELEECARPNRDARNALGKNDMMGFSRFQLPIETLAQNMESVPFGQMKDAIAREFGFASFSGFALVHAVMPAIDESRDYLTKATREAAYQIDLARFDFETATKLDNARMKQRSKDHIAFLENDLAVWGRTRRALGKVENTFVSWARKDSRIFSYELDSIPRGIAAYRQVPHPGDFTPPASAVFYGIGQLVRNRSTASYTEPFVHMAETLHGLTGEGRAIASPPRRQVPTSVTAKPVPVSKLPDSPSVLAALLRLNPQPSQTQYPVR